jgi:ParB/RepB/Spo0J family partition protein
VSAQTVSQAEQRTLALTDIRVERGFNPRDRFERKKLDELARSIALHGLLQPLVVAENACGYRLIAGERRYRAAQLAGLAQVPVVVREPDEGSSGLELAIVENVERVGLDVVEEAKAYRRLMDEQGLTRKGVAERLGVARKRVTERLQILELADELQAKLAAGEVPPAAVRALVQLGQLHPELPTVAVAEVEREKRRASHRHDLHVAHRQREEDLAEAPPAHFSRGEPDRRARPRSSASSAASRSTTAFAARTWPWVADRSMRARSFASSSRAVTSRAPSPRTVFLLIAASFEKSGPRHGEGGVA